MRWLLAVVFAALIGTILPDGARAQCSAGLITNCPPATNLQPDDVLLGWQSGQNPHTRKFPVGNIVINSSVPWIQAASYGVKADGATSNDVALKTAIDACAAAGTALLLPPGKILLTGAASATSNLRDCSLVGSGFAAGTVGSAPSFGTTILVTSTSVKPFILGGSWSIEGVNFFYPGQTGAVVYPPLFSDGGSPSNNVFAGYLHHVGIVNAYDGLAATSGVDWSDIVISDSYMYAVHDLIRLGSSGDSWRIANTHFTHGLWASIVGYPAVATYLNTADQTNTILHVTSGPGVVMSFAATTTFAWRYGVQVDAGGSILASKFDGLWDGVQTFLDTHPALACASFTTFTGSGWASYQPVFSSSGAVSVGPGNASAFNLGPGSGTCHGPYIRSLMLSGPVAGSYIVSAGEEVDIDASNLYFGVANDGNDYYAVHLTGNPGQATIAVRNAPGIGGFGAVAKMHGIKEDVTASTFTVTGNQSANLNDFLDIQTGANSTINLHKTITGNTVTNTTGSQTVIVHGFGQVLYADNDLDKPPLATVSCPGGSTATVIGGLNGSIHIGTGTATLGPCNLTLPFTPLGGAGLCVAFSSSNTRPFGGPSGTGPIVWHYSFENDAQGTQLAYTCAPTQ